MRDLPGGLAKGANAPLPGGALRADLTWRPGAGVPDVDVSVLVLDASRRVRGDADLVFYNQPAHPTGAVTHVGKRTGRDGFAGRNGVLTVLTDSVLIDLSRVPADVSALVLAGSADGGTFGGVPGLRLDVGDARTGDPVVSYAVTGAGPETAFVFGEIYRRDGGWRFRAVGQGYASGLAGLAGDFGIEVAAEDTAGTTATATRGDGDGSGRRTPAPPPRVPLAKRLADGGHHELLALTRKAAVSLDKHGLGAHTARVALVLDMSSSMSELYAGGRVQALAERALALALRFDDDGVVDVFPFATFAEYAGGLSLENYRGRVARLRRDSDVGAGTDYAEAMRAVRGHFFGTGGGTSGTSGADAGAGRSVKAPRMTGPTTSPSAPPVFVMFVTDGATSERDEARDQVRASSHEPLFWQFMALGDPEDFAFVDELRRLPGRAADNTGSFTVEDLDALTDDRLYALLTADYPRWLTEARTRGIAP